MAAATFIRQSFVCPGSNVRPLHTQALATWVDPPLPKKAQDQMFHQIRHMLEAPGKMKAAKAFLDSWCPPGVEVVKHNNSYWLSYAGMIYSLAYTQPPSPEHLPYMTEHLKNHKWALNLAGGTYTHRSILEAWCKKFLPKANVVGFSDNDIIYADEKFDRPIVVGPHKNFTVTENGRFITFTKSDYELANLVRDLKDRAAKIGSGENYWIR